MPNSAYHEGFRFLAYSERLTFEEIERVARVAAKLGVTKLRLTGGEPLLRADLPTLVERLTRIPGIEDIALTTNGMLLQRHAQALSLAGLHRVTVSLDSLDPAVFARMNGGHGNLGTVLEGIEEAQKIGFVGRIKINTVVQHDVNDTSIPELLAYFRHTDIIVRLIEYMDVGNRNGWKHNDVVTSHQLMTRINALWPLEAVVPAYRGEVAKRYRYADGGGEIGFISSVSAPFCGDCSRARLSSEGQLFTCLFATTGTDLRKILRESSHDHTDARLVRALTDIWHRRADRYSEERQPQADGQRSGKIEMHYIGG